MSGFLLDTNVPSELIRSRPDVRVVEWVRRQSTDSLFLSVISIGELRKGFTLLPGGQRRTRLEQWFSEDLLVWFQDRILPVSHSIAERWGVLEGERQLRGTPLNTADGLIAATALEHQMAVVTRNTRDFTGLGVPLVDPWGDSVPGVG